MKPLKPIHPSRLKPVLQEISKMTSRDLAQHKAWKNLAKLSTKTELSGIEAHPSGVYETGKNKFEAVATVFLTLGHPSGKSFTNSFPAHVFGTVSGNSVKIDNIKIDTSSLAS